MGENMDAQDERIQKFLGADSDRNARNELKYLDYLKKSIKFPCKLKGMEDFPWEEPYLFGGWDKKEYEELKKDRPSYTDEFELIEFLEPEDEDEEIYAKVKRIKDQKTFEIGLSWLECTDKKHINYQLIYDYGVWHVNY
jgi:hypothetical protein